MGSDKMRLHHEPEDGGFYADGILSERQTALQKVIKTLGFRGKELSFSGAVLWRLSEEEEACSPVGSLKCAAGGCARKKGIKNSKVWSPLTWHYLVQADCPEKWIAFCPFPFASSFPDV